MHLERAEAQFPHLLLSIASVSSCVFNIKVPAIDRESNGDWSRQTSGFLSVIPSRNRKVCCHSHVSTSSLHFAFILFVLQQNFQMITFLFSNDNIQYILAHSHNILRKD